MQGNGIQTGKGHMKALHSCQTNFCGGKHPSGYVSKHLRKISGLAFSSHTHPDLWSSFSREIYVWTAWNMRLCVRAICISFHLSMWFVCTLTWKRVRVWWCRAIKSLSVNGEGTLKTPSRLPTPRTNVARRVRLVRTASCSNTTQQAFPVSVSRSHTKEMNFKLSF